MSASVLDEVIQKSFKDIAAASANSIGDGLEIDVSVVDRWRAVRTLVCRPGALLESSAQAATVVAEALNGTVGWCTRAAHKSAKDKSTVSDHSRVGALVASCLWMAENTTRNLYEPQSSSAAFGGAGQGPVRRRPPMPAAASLWLSSRLVRSLLLVSAKTLEWLRAGEMASSSTGRCPLVAVVTAALSAAARGCRGAASGRSGLRRACDSGLLHMLMALVTHEPASFAASAAAQSSEGTVALRLQWEEAQAAGWDVVRALLLRADCVESWRSPGAHSAAMWQLSVAAENGRVESSSKAPADADADGKDEGGEEDDGKRRAKAGRKRGRGELSSSLTSDFSANMKPIQIEALNHRPFVHVALDVLRDAVTGAVPQAVRRAHESAVASASKHGIDSTEEGGFLGQVEVLCAGQEDALGLLPRLAGEVLEAAAAAGPLSRFEGGGAGTGSGGSRASSLPSTGRGAGRSSSKPGSQDGGSAAAVSAALGLRRLSPATGLGLVTEFVLLAAPWALEEANGAAKTRANVFLSREAEEDLLSKEPVHVDGGDREAGDSDADGKDGNAQKTGGSRKKSRKDRNASSQVVTPMAHSLSSTSRSLTCVADMLLLARGMAVYQPESERSPYPQQCLLRFLVRSAVGKAGAAPVTAGDGNPSSGNSWWGKDRTLLDPSALPMEVRAFAGAIAAQALRARWVADDGFAELAVLCPAHGATDAAAKSAEGLARLVAAAADITTQAVDAALEPALAPLLLSPPGSELAQAGRDDAIGRAVGAFARLRLLPRAWRALLAVAQAPLAAARAQGRAKGKSGARGPLFAAESVRAALSSPRLAGELAACARRAPLGQVEAMSLLTSVAAGRAARELMDSSGSDDVLPVAVTILVALVPLQVGLLSLLGAQSSSGRAAAGRCLKLLRRACLEPLVAGLHAMGNTKGVGQGAIAAAARCLVSLVGASTGVVSATGAVVAVPASSSDASAVDTRASKASMQGSGSDDESSDDEQDDDDDDDEEEDALAAAADGAEVAVGRAAPAKATAGAGVATAVAEEARTAVSWVAARGSSSDSLWWLLGGAAAAGDMTFADAVDLARGAEAGTSSAASGSGAGERAMEEVPGWDTVLAAVEGRLRLLRSRTSLGVPAGDAARLSLLSAVGSGIQSGTTDGAHVAAAGRKLSSGALLGATAAAEGLELFASSTRSRTGLGMESTAAGAATDAAACADLVVAAACGPGAGRRVAAQEVLQMACEDAVQRGQLRLALVRRCLARTAASLRYASDVRGGQGEEVESPSKKSKKKDKKKDKKRRSSAGASSEIASAVAGCEAAISAASTVSGLAGLAHDLVMQLDSACASLRQSSSALSPATAATANGEQTRESQKHERPLVLPALPAALLADASRSEVEVLLRLGAARACTAASASTSAASAGQDTNGGNQDRDRYGDLLWVLRGVNCSSGSDSAIHSASKCLAAAAGVAIAAGGSTGSAAGAAIAAAVAGGGLSARDELLDVLRQAQAAGPGPLLAVLQACAPWTVVPLCSRSHALEGTFPVDAATDACLSLPVRGKVAATRDVLSVCIAADADLINGIAELPASLSLSLSQQQPDSAGSAGRGAGTSTSASECAALATCLEVMAAAAAAQLYHGTSQAGGSGSADADADGAVRALAATAQGHLRSGDVAAGAVRLALALARASPYLGGSTQEHAKRQREKDGAEAMSNAPSASTEGIAMAILRGCGDALSTSEDASSGGVGPTGAGSSKGHGKSATTAAVAQAQAALGTAVLAAPVDVTTELLAGAMAVLRRDPAAGSGSGLGSGSSGASDKDLFPGHSVLAAAVAVRVLLACGPSSAHAGTRRMLGEQATSACAAVSSALGEWPGVAYPGLRLACEVVAGQLAGVSLARPALVPMEARDVANALLAAESCLEAVLRAGSGSGSSSGGGAWGAAGYAAATEAGRSAARHRSRLLADAFPAMSALLGRVAGAVAVPPASCLALASAGVRAGAGGGKKGGGAGQRARSMARRWCAGRAARLVEALPSLRSGARPLVVGMLVEVLRGLGKEGGGRGGGGGGGGELALAGVTPAAEEAMAFLLALLDEARPAQLQGAFDALAGDGAARDLLRAVHKRWSAERRFRASAL